MVSEQQNLAVSCMCIYGSFRKLGVPYFGTYNKDPTT